MRISRMLRLWLLTLCAPGLVSRAAAEVEVAPPSRTPPVYSVNLRKRPQDRWNATVVDVLSKHGVAPFAQYYKAVYGSLQAQFPKVLAYYEQHLAEFEKAWQQDYEDLLVELYAVSDLLVQHATTAEEREMCSRGKLFIVMMHMQIGNIGQQQECTSVVLRRSSGEIVHFRNWDFGPLPDVLGNLSVDVNFYFGWDDSDDANSRSQLQGFRCLMAMTHIHKWTTCMKQGTFSMSLNARPAGNGFERGRAPAEELELLKKGRLPRVAVLRNVMLSTTYDAALMAAATAPAITSMYVILAEPQLDKRVPGGGAVVTIRGNGTSSDVMPLPPPGQGWFIVQTNVDHWEPMGQEHYSSHRREHMKALLHKTGPNAEPEAYYALLHKDDVYPAGNPGPDDGKVFRNSTIASVLMRPGGGFAAAWRSDVWRPAPTKVAEAPLLVQTV